MPAQARPKPHRGQRYAMAEPVAATTAARMAGALTACSMSIRTIVSRNRPPDTVASSSGWARSGHRTHRPGLSNNLRSPHGAAAPTAASVGNTWQPERPGIQLDDATPRKKKPERSAEAAAAAELVRLAKEQGLSRIQRWTDCGGTDISYSEVLLTSTQGDGVYVEIKQVDGRDHTDRVLEGLRVEPR
jgi:hypothetical protein